MFTRTSLVLSPVLGLAVAGILGCQGADSTSPETRRADLASAIPGAGTPVIPGKFDLVLTPRERPEPCAVHTYLSLRAPTNIDPEGFDGRATLSEAASAYCNGVPANGRSYLLLLANIDGCNSMTYTGWLENRSIKLTDHRNSVCNAPAPARIVVTETVDGVATTLYSRDANAVPASAISGAGTSLIPGKFDLGLAPHEQPEPCAVHTYLSLRAPTNIDPEGFDGQATLSEAVAVYCDNLVPPNGRSYFLLLASIDGCNSMTYTGWLENRSIELADHRNSTCNDLAPARIVVTEIVDGVATTLYSRDGNAAETVNF